jgi:immune inhibitor A
LSINGVGQWYGGLPANNVFDDTQSYWVAPNPAINNFGWASVPLPGFGVTIRVNSVSAQNTFMQVTLDHK